MVRNVSAKATLEDAMLDYKNAGPGAKDAMARKEDVGAEFEGAKAGKIDAGAGLENAKAGKEDARAGWEDAKADFDVAESKDGINVVGQETLERKNAGKAKEETGGMEKKTMVKNDPMNP